MIIYNLLISDENPTQHQRNYDETKLTYADYHGDIPADDDIADYIRPLKGVRLA